MQATREDLEDTLAEDFSFHVADMLSVVANTLFYCLGNVASAPGQLSSAWSNVNQALVQVRGSAACEAATDHRLGVMPAAPAPPPAPRHRAPDRPRPPHRPLRPPGPRGGAVVPDEAPHHRLLHRRSVPGPRRRGPQALPPLLPQVLPRGERRARHAGPSPSAVTHRHDRSDGRARPRRRASFSSTATSLPSPSSPSSSTSGSTTPPQASSRPSP